MKLATTAKLLSDFGPSTSSDLRKKAGIKAKGCPLSTMLYRLVDGKYASKKKSKEGNVYALTTSGKKWLQEVEHEAETVEEINSMDFRAGSPKTKISPKLSKKAGIAVNGVVELINTNEETMAFLRGLHIQIGQFLENHGQLED